jgi:uncharacterized protein (DUF1499 family)
MAGADAKRDWARRLTRLALVLSVGSVAAALISSIGSGQGAWHFGSAFTVLRYAFFAAIAGGVVALVALVLARRARLASLLAANLIALVLALGFVLYLGAQVRTARSVPAIHDVATNLDDLPQFTALKVREDNLEKIPDNDDPVLKAMDPESRWKAIHREAYGEIKTIVVPTPPAETIRRAEALAKERGWEVARVDTAAGILEATDTTLFFRFKDDVVVRARPAPGGGSLVDMRSISRVGGSDVGVNAKRIRAFLKDLQQG